MLKISFILTLFFCIHAFADAKNITTPRGDLIEVMVHEAAQPNSPTIVIAPGQSCNSKGPIFSNLAEMGPAQGWTIVRMEWSYCVKDPSKPIPSDSLDNEVEDLKTAFEYAKSLPSVDSNKIVLVGKSLGSIVAYCLAQQEVKLLALALLTPVCTYTTDDNNQPLPTPKFVMEEYYPGLALKKDKIFFAIGENDSLCLLPQFHQYLSQASSIHWLTVVGGDHGWRIRNSEGKVDNIKTNANIQTALKALLNFSGQKL